MADQSNSMCNDDFEPNWDEFSFEDELKARKLNSNLFINELNAMIEPRNYLDGVEVTKFSNYPDHEKTDIEDYISEMHILKEKSQELKKEINNLKKFKLKLEDELKHLEDEITTSGEYKQHKEAYNIALTAYCENFDFEVEVNPLCEESFEALIMFHKLKCQPPIRLVINRKEKRIIKFDTSGLLTKEENDVLTENQSSLEHFPRFFAKLRQYLISKNSL